MIETLLGSKVIAGLIAGGLLAILGALISAVVFHRITAGAVSRLTELVSGGDTREARVQARNAGSALSPFLEALKGEPITPVPRPILRDTVLVAIALSPPLLLPLIGELLLDAAGASSAALAASVLIGMALLLPASLVSVVWIIHLGVRSSRAVRAACVVLLASQVRAAVLKKSVEPSAGRAEGERVT
jgi:hypothetical protein